MRLCPHCGKQILGDTLERAYRYIRDCHRSVTTREMFESFEGSLQTWCTRMSRLYSAGLLTRVRRDRRNSFYWRAK